MDVSIKSADKQAREAVIKARHDKQTAQAKREKKREARKTKKMTAVTTNRLRRRIMKEVRVQLLTEKRLFLAGHANGDEYEIDTVVPYKKTPGKRYRRPFVESILKEALANHSGFEYKADFMTDHSDDEWCNSIRIWYTLLDN